MWSVTEIPPSQDKRPIMLRRFRVAAYCFLAQTERSDISRNISESTLENM